MCLAAPAAVLSVHGDEALVDLDGVRLKVSTALLDDVAPGDVVLVHVGFALSKIDPEEAERTHAALAMEARP